MGSYMSKIRLKVAYYTPKTDSLSLMSDGISKDVALLFDHTNKAYLNRTTLFPNCAPKGIFPRIVGVFYRVWFIAKFYLLDQLVDLHFISSPRPINLLGLSLIRKPIVFSSPTKFLGFETSNEFNDFVTREQKYRAYIVVDDEDASIINNQGKTFAKVIIPSVEHSKKTLQSIVEPPQDEVRFIFASSPWSFEQFETKGLASMFRTMSTNPKVSLFLLWRGLFRSELDQYIRDYKVESQVTVIDEIVDIDEYYNMVHGAIAIFSSMKNNKAYPNSIFDSIIRGKPVIVSSNMPISGIIAKYKAGIVLKLGQDDLSDVIKEYVAKYEILSKGAVALSEYLSPERYVQEYEKFLDKTV